MPQPDTTKLDTGDRFPALTLNLISGDEYNLPAEKWTLFLVYRGNW